MPFRRPRSLVALAFLTLASVASAQTPAEIIANHSKAVDPEGKLASHQGMKMTANFDVPAAGMSGSVVMYQRRPNQQLMIVGIPQVGEMKSGYDGATAWASDPFQGPRLLTGLEAAAASEGAEFRSIARPAEMFTANELAGEADIDGEKCIKVKHTWLSGRTSVDCYSTKTWLLLESTTTAVTAQGEMQSTTRYSDFRAVGGVMLPHKLAVQAMGMQQNVTTTSIEWGEQPASAVEMPAEVKALKKP